MIYGYDSQTDHCFVYDQNKDIRYLGKREHSIDSPPCSRNEALILAAIFTSGFTVNSRNNSFPVIFPDGRCFSFVTPFAQPWTVYGIGEIDTEKDRFNEKRICFVGKPQDSILNRFPGATVHVLNVGDGAVALGYLFHRIMDSEPFRPRKMWFLNKNEAEIAEAEKKAYESNLPTDAAGKMAYNCARGMPIVNERFTTAGESAFHDRLIVPRYLPGISDKYIISSQNVHKFFPRLPLSWQYAATCITMDVHSTDEFRQETGDSSDKVKLSIVSGCADRDLQAFIQFWSIMSGGKKIIVSAPKKRAEGYKKVMVYRHNGSYLLDQYVAGM